MDTASYRIEKRHSDYRLTYNNTHQHIIDFDLERIIYEYIEGHVSKIVKICQMFDTDDESLLTDELGRKVLENLPKTWDYITPGIHDYTPKELREHHHQYLLYGYNIVFNTDFKYEIIAGLI